MKDKHPVFSHMDYDPKKRLNEIRSLLKHFVEHCNQNFNWEIESDIEIESEKILLVYNELVHRRVKPYVKERIDRNKIIVATQFSIMHLKPIKFSAQSSNKPISNSRLNAILCWTLYISLVLDFPSINDLNEKERKIIPSKAYVTYRDNYITWLTLISPLKVDVFITSWYLQLFTQNHLLRRP